MSDGLIGDASAQVEEPKTAEQTDVSHRAADPAQAQQVNPASQQSAAWVDGLSKSLYVDGKPNFEALPEKYWKDGNPDIGSALKARAELEKAFSRGDHKAPAEYDVSFAKEAGIPDDDALLGTFKGWAKENGISQDAFKKLAASYIEMQQQAAKQFQINVEAEKQKLGPNADKIIGEMVGWGQNMVRKGIWSADDFEEFKVMGGTARGINALMKVREFYGDMQRIPVDTASVGDQPSRDELNQMVADPRYQSDPAFRSKVEKLFERMYSE
jgi:hypothetical protein